MRLSNFLYILVFICQSTLLFAYDAITPGERWNDSKGVQINAHGGCLVYHENAYYWFGEDRNVFYSNGVSCYKSSDLYNWTKLGLAFTPSGTKDPQGNDAAPGRTLERPKVIYNESTEKWVMFIHWENGQDYGDAKVCVATSDKIEGPYSFYRTYRPNGHDSRDQTLFKDSEGKAYHFGSTNMNSDMLISELSSDYLEVTGTENYALTGKKYEAPSVFKVGDLYYGLFSGCTGWSPNPGHTAQTLDLMGEWSPGENFCVDINKETSYGSQSAYVFKVPGYENAYIYMGDRWISTNPGSSNVVWLPLSVRSGYPTVRWHDKWDMSVFEDADRYKRARSIDEGNNYLFLERYADRFISQGQNGLVIDDNNELTNLSFQLITTDQPYTYKIKEVSSGKYFESIFGSLRINSQNDNESQKWVFILQEDGSFYIKNKSDDKYFAISGGGTYANSGVYLSDVSRARAFCPYFDSKTYNYPAADMYSQTYFQEQKRLKEEQEEYFDTISSIEPISAEERMIKYQIFDMTGKLIFEKQTNEVTDEDINSISPVSGIYILRRYYGNYIKTEKIIF